jgi:hypothetical protein
VSGQDGPLESPGVSIVARRTRLAGRLLMAIAAIHAAFGLWFGRRALGAIARGGFVDAVDPHPDRGLVFWFLLASPLVWFLGRMAIWLAGRNQPPPAWLGRDLMLVSVVVVLLMPVSGGWLLLAPAGLLIAATRGGDRG